MNDAQGRTRARACLAWVSEVAARDSARGFREGFGDGLLLGFALAAIDPGWANAAMDELIQVHRDRLAEALSGTPVPAPSLEEHRLLVFGQAQEMLRRATELVSKGQSQRL